jgi:hypothetical protein
MKSPAHVFDHPESQSGVGSLVAYRAIRRESQPLLQTPIRWASQQAAFTALSASPEPTTASHLHASGAQFVPKVWTELADETVRAHSAPLMPSRLAERCERTETLVEGDTSLGADG